MAALAGVGGPESCRFVTGLCGMPYFDVDPDLALARFETAMAFDADGRIARSRAWVTGYAAPLYVDRGDGRTALATVRAGISTSHSEGDHGILTSSFEYAGVALSMLGFHEPASLLYATVDTPVAAPLPLPEKGWQAVVRRHGRALTLAALGPGAIERRRDHTRAMSVADVVAFALVELDTILAGSDV